jgi:FkbH-like protein
MDRATSANLRIEFLQALKGILPAEPGIVVVHSSLAMIAPGVPLSKWDIHYAVGVLAGEGWTFAFPAFTFSFCKGKPFRIGGSPSETGAIADWLLEAFPEALRTRHPIYSFCVYGPQAHRIAACKSTTTFGDDSPFELFERENATILMAGCGWEYCTLFHRYEEKAAVSYRVFKDFSGDLVYAHGTVETVTASMFVRDLEIGGLNDFNPAVQALETAGAIREVALWRGKIAAASAKSIADVCTRLLAEEPLSFVSNRAEVRKHLNDRCEAELAAPYRIALLGSSNLDVAREEFASRLKGLLTQRRCKIMTVPYGQMFTDVMNASSDLNSDSPDLAIFCDRLEDLFGVASISKIAFDLAPDRVEAYIRCIRQLASTSGAWVVVHRFALSGRLSCEDQTRIAGEIARLNEFLVEGLKDLDKIIWLDPACEASTSEPVFDSRLWYVGRIPFSQPYMFRLIDRWSGIVLSALEKSVRLVVVDLDNTMWGGVLGEDGLDGIKIGGDYPGNAFQDFQAAIKALSDRGIALAVSSKNDEDLALKVLEDHQEMVLRQSDFVTHRINWQPKWQNIKSIANELSLGLGSVLFVDDNPVERESVARNLPEVKILDLPADPTLYLDSLKDCVWLESIKTGQEDLKRVASYKARKKITEQLEKSENIDDFLSTLDMTLHVSQLDESNIARASQLCQKTNQFNTTTRRYTSQDLTALVENGSDVAVIGLEDKYSPKENIGLIILKPQADLSIGEVDLFLLSCRVLGRTVEKAVLNWAVNRARDRGWNRLDGRIIKTPRNTPARKVFDDASFEFDKDSGLWSRQSGTGEIPPWFKVQTNFS